MCASCRSSIAGKTASVVDFSKVEFNYGSDKKSIIRNITMGIPEKGMPSWKGEISKLYLYTRPEVQKLSMTSFKD